MSANAFVLHLEQGCSLEIIAVKQRNSLVVVTKDLSSGIDLLALELKGQCMAYAWNVVVHVRDIDGLDHLRVN